MAQTDSGWFLRHRDGIEHGPFRLEDLVSAAQAGNVADDTSVKHETHTRGVWIVAPRVQPIAMAMSRRTGEGKPAVKSPPQPTGFAAPPTQAAERGSPTTHPMSETSAATPTPTRAVARPGAVTASAPASNPQRMPASSANATSPTGSAPAAATRTAPGGMAPQSTAPAGTAPASTAPAGTGPAATGGATATKSAFRLPGGQPPAALPGSTPFRSNRGAEAAAGNEPTPSGDDVVAQDSKPVHTVRIHNQTFPVPKRFFDAALALFDFRFRYFITPWIVKILWALTVTVALLWLTRLTYEVWIQPSVGAPGPRIEDGTPGWEFEPLDGQSVFQSRGFLYGVNVGVAFLLVLCARVAMESVIVFFRVSSDIAELKRTP